MTDSNSPARSNQKILTTGLKQTVDAAETGNIQPKLPGIPTKDVVPDSGFHEPPTSSSEANFEVTSLSNVVVYLAKLHVHWTLRCDLHLWPKGIPNNPTLRDPDL